MPYECPPALPHGTIEQLFEDIFFVTGTVRVRKPPLSFSRNMTVLRSGDSLTLVNSMRLDEAGLAALDELGKVEHVVRLCGFHGMDDPFYKQRYDAKVWAVEGHRYVSGFNNAKREPETYFEADAFMTSETELPVPGAKLFCFDTARPKEGMLLLEREGGILVSGDPLQNWMRADRYFNLIARVMMRVLGFIKAHNVGPGWLDGAKVERSELNRLLELAFEHVLPAHGTPVLGGAKEKFRPAIARAAKAKAKA